MLDRESLILNARVWRLRLNLWLLSTVQPLYKFWCRLRTRVHLAAVRGQFGIKRLNVRYRYWRERRLARRNN